LIFYNLDKALGRCHRAEDRSGRATVPGDRAFEVEPADTSRAMDSVRDRDIVTLRACTPIPTCENASSFARIEVKSAKLRLKPARYGYLQW